ADGDWLHVSLLRAVLQFGERLASIGLVVRCGVALAEPGQFVGVALRQVERFAEFGDGRGLVPALLPGTSEIDVAGYKRRLGGQRFLYLVDGLRELARVVEAVTERHVQHRRHWVQFERAGHLAM